MRQELLPSVNDFVKSASCARVKKVAGMFGNIAGALARHPYLAMGGVGALGAGVGVAHGLLSDQQQQQPPQAPYMGFDPDTMGGAATLGLAKGFGGEVGKGIVDLVRGVAHGVVRVFRRDPLEDIVASDPVLADADPAEIEEAYATMKRFAPTLASDKNAVRAFLREAVTSGGGVNYNTIKMLSDAENSAQEGGAW